MVNNFESLLVSANTFCPFVAGATPMLLNASLNPSRVFLTHTYVCLNSSLSSTRIFLKSSLTCA